MNYVPIVVATDLEVHFSVLKKGVPILLSIQCMYKSLVFGDEFLAQFSMSTKIKICTHRNY